MNSSGISEIEQQCLAIRKIGREKFSGGYERIVFTNGCFDILHPGHLIVLRRGRELAGTRGALVVGINDDESVLRLKGVGRPVMVLAARSEILLALRFVDHVIPFGGDNPQELIEKLRPGTVLKGGDYDPAKIVGAKLAFTTVSGYDPAWSTSDIVKKIKGE